tara:strand:- start:347 stop:907 length:561 start_codon:yes stop_codon:yes gene_type:complete
MSFWSENNVEPKRNFRFLVQFTGLSGDTAFGQADVLWWAKTVTTPSFDVGEVSHDFLDNKYYYPGRVTWSEVSMTLVDPVSPDAVGQTNHLLEQMGYVIPSNDGKMTTISKVKAAAALGDVIITIYDAAGDVELEKWTLQNPFVKSAKYGDLDYSNDELRTITLGLRYDWATCDIDGAETQFKRQT